MKRICLGSLCITILLLSVGCAGDQVRKSPVGVFSFGSTLFEMKKDGTFRLEHTSSGEDSRHYIIIGTFTYTHEFSDEENEISFGKIDLTVNSLTLNGSSVDSLEVTDLPGKDMWPGVKLQGWWKYMNLVSYGGKMLLRFSLPSRGHRPEDVNSGADWLVAGDPD